MIKNKHCGRARFAKRYHSLFRNKQGQLRGKGLHVGRSGEGGQVTYGMVFGFKRAPDYKLKNDPRRHQVVSKRETVRILRQILGRLNELKHEKAGQT